MRSPEKSGRTVAMALVGATLFAAGCGGLSKESIEKREEAKRQNTEKKLKATLDPAVARLGRKAARFVKEHPQNLGWYKDFDEQWNLSISDTKGNHTVDLYLRKDEDRSNITSGDIEFLKISNQKRITNIFGRKYDLTTEVRVETLDNPDAVCGHGLEASYDYTYVSPHQGDESSGFITADRCNGSAIGFEISKETTSARAARAIIKNMNSEANEVFSNAK